MEKMKRKMGFTLVELMIVVVIIAIIASIAFPSYMSYVARTRRSEGQSGLLELAARMERYYAQNNTYANASTSNSVGLAGLNLGLNYYTLSITAADATTYILQAAPKGSQATSDTKCATLTLDQLGTKQITGTGTVKDCWGQ